MVVFVGFLSTFSPQRRIVLVEAVEKKGAAEEVGFEVGGNVQGESGSVVGMTNHNKQKVLD